MGWQFAGFFVQAELTVLEAALRSWPGCRGRLVTEPFHGIGVAVPDDALTYGETEDDQAHAQELAWNLEDGLVEWSRRFPTTRFVFIRAECFGGTCLYAGYVCENGATLLKARDTDGSGDALRRLVLALGVELGDPLYFEPLTRRFFDHSG